MKVRIWASISLIMLIALLAACGQQATQGPVLPSASATPSSVPTTVPTATFTPAPTATAAPTSTPTATIPPTSTPRPTNTPRPPTSGGGAPVRIPTMSPQVAALVDQLLHGDEATRRAAAEQLARMGPQAAAAMPALIQALSDPNQDVRALVAQALRAFGPQASGAVPALIQALATSSGSADEAIAATLRTITGQDFGLDAARWQQWWQQQQATIAADHQRPDSGAPLDFPTPTQLDAWEPVEGGYRVTIIVRISGGRAPFVVQHDLDTFVTTQRDYPLVFLASGCTINHTIAVNSSDGQRAEHSYWIHAPWCE